MILRAAANLFFERGYANVTMLDMANAVNIAPGALYRHFSSKSELLVATLRTELEPWSAVLGDTSAPANHDESGSTHLFRRLAECAIDHRELGVLWQREARNLDEFDQRALRRELRDATGSLTDHVRGRRADVDEASADLLAWCSMGALVSIGFHSLALPRTAYVDLLVNMCNTIASVLLPTVTDPPPPSVHAIESRPRTRGLLIDMATKLFAEHGFGAIGVDEIGAGIGIAGPSVYGHFPSKQSLLSEITQKGNDLLTADADRAFATETSPARKLASLVESYVQLAVTNRFVLRIVLSEMDALDPTDRQVARRQQREYIDRWTSQLIALSGEDAVAARIRVQAVLLMVNDAAQTPHLRSRPGFAANISRIAFALLYLDDESAASLDFIHP